MIWDVEREIVSVGDLALRWYSLLFALSIVLGYFIVQSMFKKEGKPLHVLDSLLFHIVVGIVVGARLGHCLLYEPMEYLTDPLRILKIWEGGLASHGGFLGVVIALVLWCRKHHEVTFFWLCDRLTIPAMLTAGLIRIGNFFNSEIVGRATDVPWAVVFKKFDDVPRHPTQIYEAIGYLAIGLLHYAIYRAKDRKPKEGVLFGLVFVLGYSFRVFVEHFKENQVPFEDALPLNMGQLLSIPFIILGLLVVFGIQDRVAWLRRGLSPEAGGPTLAPVGGDGPRSDEGAGKSRRGDLRHQAKKAQKAQKGKK